MPTSAQWGLILKIGDDVGIVPYQLCVRLLAKQGTMENAFLSCWREILARMKARKPQEYFVYFKVFKLHSCAERSARRAEKDFSW